MSEHTEQLRLLAESADDLTVLSAVVQDMTIKLSDMAYLPRQHRFAFVGNRFRWEKSEPHIEAGGDAKFAQPNERVRAACRFENVLHVASKDMPKIDKMSSGSPAHEHVLGILSLEVGEQDNGDFSLTLHFYGGGAMKLVCECLEIYIEDLSEPWTTTHRPEHDLDDADNGEEA